MCCIINGVGSNLAVWFSERYKEWLEEGIIMNSLAVTLVALGVLLSYAVRRSNLRGPSPAEADLDPDNL